MDDSEDEKKMEKAERQAEKKVANRRKCGRPKQRTTCCVSCIIDYDDWHIDHTVFEMLEATPKGPK